MIKNQVKRRHLSRIVFRGKDPESFKETEKQTLWVGIWVNFLMGIAGWVGYYFAESYALALDGNLSFISAVSFFVALRITEQKDIRNEKYPFGFYSVESIYAFLQGILLIGITVYALLQGMANILEYSKGNIPAPLKLLPLAIYTVSMLFACGGVWLFYRRQFEKTERQSPILHTETVSAFMDTLVTAGTGVALILVALIPQGSALQFLNYIGDSIIVIILSLFLIREPLKIVSFSFFSLVGRTLQNPRLKRRAENIIITSLDPIFRLQKFHIIHIGSCYEVEVTITVVDDMLMDMPLFRLSRQTMDDRLRTLFPNLILEVLLL